MVRQRRTIENGCKLSVHDSRFSCIAQDPLLPGIFGAMTQGFALAGPNDWLLFWGSDDWSSGQHVFSQVMSLVADTPRTPDLVVCSGRYVDSKSGKLSRVSFFKPFCFLNGALFRRALFCGLTPPHQATLFGPGARSFLSNYTAGFRLAADLDYFTIVEILAYESSVLILSLFIWPMVVLVVSNLGYVFKKSQSLSSFVWFFG